MTEKNVEEVKMRDPERSRMRIIRGRISMLKRRFCLKVVFLRSFVRSKITRKAAVHVIGDSHTGIFLKRRPFVVYWLGPATAHNLNNPGSTTGSYTKLMNILNHIVGGRDEVLLVFGEVDCRIHIYNQYMMNKETRSLEEVIDRTISRYGEVLHQIDSMGINFHVSSVPPGGKEGNVFGVPNYPPPEVRCAINRIFNERLGDYCNSHGFSFIDVYSVVVDCDGFIKPEFSYRDGTHLNREAVKLFEERLGVQR